VANGRLALPAPRVTETPVPLLAFERFASTAAFRAGEFDGVAVAPGMTEIVLDRPGGGTWTGPWLTPGFVFQHVIASWNGDTPPGTFIVVELQGRKPDDGDTGWYILGKWAFDDTTFERTSVGGQRDENGDVTVDVFTAGTPLLSYRLRLTLTGSPESSPTIRLLTAIAATGTGIPSIVSTALTGSVELEVPTYAQGIHAGEYPELDGGGEAWCSPTSTAMVMAFWGAGPTPVEMAWVSPDYADPWVDHAARFTFDREYQGTGNWSFNTAYAGHYGLDAFVTRLRSLQEAELFVHAGIPLVTSISVEPGALDGFQLPRGTSGHLVVIVGFTPEGNVIVNDPATDANDTVRRVYDRAQFEAVWIGGSGGVAYVITRPGVELPPSPGNW
jgi:Peptidase_C39 like family